MMNPSSDEVIKDEVGAAVEAGVVGAIEHPCKGLTRAPLSHS